MPFEFSFRAANGSSFKCNLSCEQCRATSTSAQRCKNVSCMGVPYCWIHLAKEKHLRIKTSTIPHAGKGLFAVGREHEIVFPEGSLIVEYEGETINTEELERRYGDHTAVYVLKQKHNTFVDSACKRGIAALANTKPTREECNAWFTITRRGKKLRLEASQDIYGGDEIFAYYGSEYTFDEDVTYGTRYKRK